MSLESWVVSVILPVYNGERFVADAVASVRRQRYPHLDIVVVDDGSTDGTAAVVARLQPGIRYVQQPNRGTPAARNVGLKMARGSVIGFVDADDVWVDNKLELQLAKLAADPSTDIVYGHTQVMQQVSGSGEALRFEEFEAPKLALALQAALFRAHVFERVGPFDETQRYCDDVEWFLRAQDAGLSMVSHPEVVWFYRQHDQNLTKQVDIHQQYLATAIRKALLRRRQREGGRGPG